MDSHGRLDRAVAANAGAARRRTGQARRGDSTFRSLPRRTSCCRRPTTGCWPIGISFSNRRDAYERARIESFKQTPENQLQQHVVSGSQPLESNDQPLPSELDENTLFAFRALFEKSAQPGKLPVPAARSLRGLPRLPAAADGARCGPGPLAGAGVRVPQHAAIQRAGRSCATKRRPTRFWRRQNSCATGERTPTDLRALDLLEAVVERKSSEVLNQPGPHAEACLAALQPRLRSQVGRRGAACRWSSFLYQMGTLRDAAARSTSSFANCRELQKLAASAGRDHLLITNDLCNVLFWSYGRQDEAIREMETEVREYEQAHERDLAASGQRRARQLRAACTKALVRHAAGESGAAKVPRQARTRRAAQMAERSLDDAVQPCPRERRGRVDRHRPREDVPESGGLDVEGARAAADENVRYERRLATVEYVRYRAQSSG